MYGPKQAWKCPRHDDYDEDEYLLKTRPLRDTRSEGKVKKPPLKR